MLIEAASHFYSPDKAEQVARDLGKYDDDGWEYRAIHQNNELSYVEIYDELGEFVARF